MAVTTSLEQSFDRKLDIVTAGLTKEHSNLLEKIPSESALTVMDYIISLIAEVNPSANYRKDIIKCLTRFIKFCHNSKEQNFKQQERKEVLAFLDSLRKSEIRDPLHTSPLRTSSVLSINIYDVHPS
jgi:hemerythrin-like domain-containing protein